METAYQELGQTFCCNQFEAHKKQVRADVSFWPKADVVIALNNVCFRM
jgi:hypothetical protein